MNSSLSPFAPENLVSRDGFGRPVPRQSVPFVLLLLFLTFSALVANPKKTTLHGRQSRSWSAEQGKKEKIWQRLSPPPPPPPARAAQSEKKKKKKITRRIHIYRRYASRRYAGGLGPSRILTRIPTTRQLGQWVSLRKTLRFRVRLQLSQSCCLSLLLAMSSRVFLFFPPRGHEPPPTLRGRLNPNLSLYRHRFPIPRYAKRPDVALYTVGPFFLLPPRPLRTAPSRFPNMIRFGNRPPPIQRSVPAHKSLLVRNAVSMLSHPVISRARLYEVIRWSGLLRCAPMMRSKTRWCTVRSLA